MIFQCKDFRGLAEASGVGRGMVGGEGDECKSNPVIVNR